MACALPQDDARSSCMSATTYLGGEMTTDQRIRQEWAESLAEHMTHRDMSVKQLVAALAELDVEVTRQAVESWLAGKTSPRPSHQAALGTVFDIPARRMFSIENLPRRAA